MHDLNAILFFGGIDNKNYFHKSSHLQHLQQYSENVFWPPLYLQPFLLCVYKQDFGFFTLLTILVILTPVL
uniref:Uncharacterized protein n=1 Tax=Rhizophora mucronata TaxID=61149 RepID=A0A2P2PDR5_RHIMU